VTSKTEQSSRKLILIDGNGLAYRSFYAVPPQKTASGLPTQAVLGFTNLLLSVLEKEKPTHVAVAFDQCAPTERLQKFQPYNVQREEMPEELAVQLPVIEDLVRECGLAACRVPGHEADDCIGTLARRAQEDAFEVLIVSGDLDLLQLVGPSVRVQTTRRGIGDLVVYDEAGVRKKYNLEPRQLADLRALAGDSSQNISGVPGIGEVTARKLLSQYRSLDDLFSSLDQLPAKWRNPLLENREDAREFRVRATIVTDLPINLDWERCRFQGLSTGRLAEILARLEALSDFQLILDRLGAGTSEDYSVTSEPRVLSALEARDALAALAADNGALALAWLRSEGVERGLGVAWGSPVESFYVGLGAQPEELPAEEAWDLLAPALERSDRPKYLHRMRDVAALRRGHPAGVLDLAVASALLDSGERDHSLEAVARRHDRSTASEDELWGVGARALDGIPVSQVAEWTVRRARTLLDIGPLLQERLCHEGLERVYSSVDLPFSCHVSGLDGAGLALDRTAIEAVAQAVDRELEALRKEIHAEADRPFDLDCDKELGEFLFDSLGLLVPTRPKNGGAIGAEILVSLVGQHPIALTVRNYRELAEFRQIFVEGFLADGRSVDGVGGCLFNPAMTVEERLQWLGPVACGGPVATWHRMLAVIENLQCVSLRRRLADLVEQTLVPSSPDGALLALEFDQLELRVLARLAGDEVLARALEGEDLEAALAGRLFGAESLEVLPGMRRVAMQAVLHGMGPRWLARCLDVTEDRAAERLSEVRADFRHRFPVAENWFEARFRQARDMAALTTLAGRSRRVPEVRSRNHDIREAAERTARSAALEGSVADLLKSSVVGLANLACASGPVVPHMNRILLEVPEARIEQVAREAQEHLQQVGQEVGLVVRWQVGKNGHEVLSARLQPAAC